MGHFGVVPEIFFTVLPFTQEIVTCFVDGKTVLFTGAATTGLTADGSLGASGTGG